MIFAVSYLIEAISTKFSFSEFNSVSNSLNSEIIVTPITK